MPETVRVDLPGRAYDVVIGPALLEAAAGHIAPLLARRKVAVITDETVAGLHLPALRAALEAEGIAVDALSLPSGEATKSWAQLERCADWLLDRQVERQAKDFEQEGGFTERLYRVRSENRRAQR